MLIEPFQSDKLLSMVHRSIDLGSRTDSKSNAEEGSVIKILLGRQQVERIVMVDTSRYYQAKIKTRQINNHLRRIIDKIQPSLVW